MARGLMEGYANTTPAGFEGVGGNPPGESPQTPDMNVANQTADTGQTTDTGQPVEAASAVEQAFNNLSEESKASFSAISSASSIAALKEFFSGMGMPPEEVAALDKIPTKEMIHIPVDALLNNPERVMSELQNVAMQAEGQTTDMAQADRGMMANEAATNRPPTQPV